ncbi:hypothetical protein J3Q64DRAFT_1823257 [Phycomyces blakesleeanus]|uniref:Uncharacterized protein n=2 Tax=Phycomyces blakesleeanus TaxID=4837 RepID=A0A167MIB1_PHYB8|nr:hypothetical protein PHYBLDRAFT_65156 [Phycomyces blakesleeanus NRRL 1555(-)]OAD72916.1 hypothetical protein PHYBLDRAFT_65156 [Phycomyces blakesleeanus NRRL 1555(-)]|eukprot:XP_018290956.1 hypothetical protein PHYBLDRAFT_65156 [Phycomyces blakesleeanus NRRL 1555(-)]
MFTRSGRSLSMRSLHIDFMRQTVASMLFCKSYLYCGTKKWIVVGFWLQIDWLYCNIEYIDYIEYIGYIGYTLVVLANYNYNRTDQNQAMITMGINTGIKGGILDPFLDQKGSMIMIMIMSMSMSVSVGVGVVIITGH